jgi:hypothetical protein
MKTATGIANIGVTSGTAEMNVLNEPARPFRASVLCRLDITQDFVLGFHSAAFQAVCRPIDDALKGRAMEAQGKDTLACPPPWVRHAIKQRSPVRAR